jgi:hypothetical protein
MIFTSILNNSLHLNLLKNHLHLLTPELRSNQLCSPENQHRKIPSLFSQQFPLIQFWPSISVNEINSSQYPCESL